MKLKPSGPIPLMRIQHAINLLNPETSNLQLDSLASTDLSTEQTNYIKEDDPWFFLLSSYPRLTCEEKLKIKEDFVNNSPLYDSESKIFLGPHFLEKENILNFKLDSSVIPRLCRPWSRLDLLNRIATFNASDLPSLKFSPQIYARFGWAFSNEDNIHCRSCDALVQDFIDVDSEVEINKLLKSSHYDDCPWKKANCFPELYSIPESSLIGLKSAFIKHFEVLKKSIQSSLSHTIFSLDSDLLTQLLNKYQIPCDNQNMSIAHLVLYGWFPLSGTPSPQVQCWFCCQALELCDFTSLSTIHNADSQNYLLDAASQHKDCCPYINEKQWPKRWLSAITYSYQPSILPHNRPLFNSTFDWNSSKTIITKFRSTLDSNIQHNLQPRRRVSRFARRPLSISSNSLREQITRRYEKLRSHKCFQENSDDLQS